MKQKTNSPQGPVEPETPDDSFLRLASSGKHVWEDEPADEYVNNLQSPADESRTQRSSLK